MEKQITANVKLGLFVIAALLILVFSLYMIGRNKSFFGSKIEVKARFRNVNGLMRGNNVRFAGIQAGTVKEIVIINDTTIEVVMLVDDQTRKYIHKNSFASIGNEGLMGNKIINIEPNPVAAPLIEEGDMLFAVEARMGDMLQTLDKTNVDVNMIAAEALETIRKINSSPVIWRILTDSSLPSNLRSSLDHINASSVHIYKSASQLEVLTTSVRNGEGVAGMLLSDTEAAVKIRGAIDNIHLAGIEAKVLLIRLDSISSALESGINNENGLAFSILNDTVMTGQLSRSLVNIEKGTLAFSEDMEALKHNFLTRRYFKKKKNNRLSK